MRHLFIILTLVMTAAAPGWSASSTTRSLDMPSHVVPSLTDRSRSASQGRAILRLVPAPVATASSGTPNNTGATLPVYERDELSFGRRSLLWSVYVGGYIASTQVGTRLGLDNDYKVIRLESAYMYDVIAHIYVVKNMGQILDGFNQWVGVDAGVSRPRAAWYGAFGMLSYMEILNGFMPTVRLDPLDIPANAAGAWLADDGQDILSRHPHLERVTLQLGYKSVSHIFDGTESNTALGNAWHDYPNARFGLGYDIGPFERPWITMMATYDITSFKVETMENRFGMGIEFRAVNWLAPLIEHVPGGETFLTAFDWFDDRLIIPGLYVQLFTVDTGAWSQRDPFHE